MGKMTIGPYEVVRLLGKGGMSEVYEAEHARLGSRHAVKLFSYEKDDPEVLARFQTEGRLLAKLSHPRIVKVTDFGTLPDGGRPYFVMDLVLDETGQAKSLADVTPGSVNEEEIGRWYDDLREGLAYIHANGVIHRDLKLQNVLIGPDGHAVLTDFGISKVSAAKGDGRRIVDTVQTIVKVREGRSLVMGSLGYMAPELEMGAAATPASDWYALGVIVYRLLTGTWCDARTDIVSSLATFDPVWKRILPKLLHLNPQGRECLSYADERRAECERAAFEMEERWLKAKARGHNARHVARYLAVSVLVGVVLSAAVLLRERQKLNAARETIANLREELQLPTFSEVCYLDGRAAPVDAQGFDNSGREKASLVDTWVLTHGIFDDLRQGRISYEKATDQLSALLKKAREDHFSLFDIGGEYTAIGDPELVVRILSNAVEIMKARAGTSSGMLRE